MYFYGCDMSSVANQRNSRSRTHERNGGVLAMWSGAAGMNPVRLSNRFRFATPDNYDYGFNWILVRTAALRWKRF